MGNSKSNITLDCRIENLAVLATEIDRIAENCGADSSQSMRLQLACEEIFTNIVFYAYSEPLRESINISIECTDGELTVEFRDRGIEFNPLEAKAPDVDLPVGDREVGGLGIFLVLKTMDSVDYARTNGENILTIKKKIIQ